MSRDYLRLLWKGSAQLLWLQPRHLLPFFQPLGCLLWCGSVCFLIAHIFQSDSVLGLCLPLEWFGFVCELLDPPRVCFAHPLLTPSTMRLTLRCGLKELCLMSYIIWPKPRNLSTKKKKKNPKHESCKSSFIWGTMRTAARDTGRWQMPRAGDNL